jgi:two-component sensor histidine kinase
MNSNAEIHHYIKNVLQAIISYSNTAIINKNAGPLEATLKLNTFVHVLAFVQDLVFAQEPLNFKCHIRADTVIQKAVDLLSNTGEITQSDFPEFSCPVKRATNLTLIFLEIVSCLRKKSASPLHVEITQTGDKEFFFNVHTASGQQNELSEEALAAELKLASALTKSDLKSSLQYSTSPQIGVSAQVMLTD